MDATLEDATTDLVAKRLRRDPEERCSVGGVEVLAHSVDLAEHVFEPPTLRDEQRPNANVLDPIALGRPRRIAERSNQTLEGRTGRPLEDEEDVEVAVELVVDQPSEPARFVSGAYLDDVLLDVQSLPHRLVDELVEHGGFDVLILGAFVFPVDLLVRELHQGIVESRL